MSRKTTIYLPDDLKRAVEIEAKRRGSSEAEVMRRAIADAVRSPSPQGGLFEAEPIAERADELLEGFGRR
jgi:predicted transcriptional regulator